MRNSAATADAPESNKVTTIPVARGRIEAEHEKRVNLLMRIEVNARLINDRNPPWTVLDRPVPAGYGRWTGPLIAAELGDVDVQYIWRFLRAQCPSI
jgi:hypothetical protein